MRVFFLFVLLFFLVGCSEYVPVVMPRDCSRHSESALAMAKDCENFCSEKGLGCVQFGGVDCNLIMPAAGYYGCADSDGLMHYYMQTGNSTPYSGEVEFVIETYKKEGVE